MSIPKGEEKKGIESISKKITDENFPNLWKELGMQIQEVNRTLNYLKTKRCSPTCYIKTYKLMTKKEFSRKIRGRERL